METESHIQQRLFQEIKEKVPSTHSFVHEIADILGLSYDSAYRRIRGDKEISLEELYKLTLKFNLSLDNIFSVQSQEVCFQCAPLNCQSFKVKDWLSLVLHNTREISEAREKEIIYAAKDVPVFHYFQIPEIAAFKIFFWEKTLFQFPEYDDLYFRLDEIDPEVIRIGQQALFYATKIPAKEIWNQDTFNIMLRQIEYYWISGIIRKKDDALNLIDKVDLWIRHIHKQAEQGTRLMFEQSSGGIENSFQFYENDVVLSDNTILVNTDGKTTVYLTFNVLSLLVTHNSSFAGHISKFLNGLLKKSNLISLYGARDRNRFFNTLSHSIETLKNRISH
ncbi:MAG: helix-turn-helix domain-containing protein [Bacteroidales bacterium]